MDKQASKRMKRRQGWDAVSLQLECYDIELSPEQKEYYNKDEEEYNRFQEKLNTVIQNRDVIVEKGDNVSYLEFFSTNNTLGSGSEGSPLVVPGSQQPTPGNIIVQQTNNGTGNYQLVVDPRLGVIVGSTPATTQLTTTPVTVTPRHVLASSSVGESVLKVMRTAGQGHGRGQVATRGGKSQLFIPVKKKGTIATQPLGLVRTQQQQQQQSQQQQSQLQQSGIRIRTKPKQQQDNEGGSPAVVDLTDDDPANQPTATVPAVFADSKEISINKMSGKTFPSLVVVARPHLTAKDCPPAQAQAERQFLDAKVKKVLMVSASSFTEWLLQNGLLKCEQVCSKHVTTDGKPVKLKLGMYSDMAKFPYSGGYVWISECCPQQFVSVFSGSIFEGAPHPPTTLLKLLYHWCCHTSIQNVTQWVKVDNLYVKSFYTHLRSVCTAAVHQKCTKMGGNRKKIQVGVISLGTTTQDGSTRQVKVEVLGVLDPETKHLRIRAIEPIQEAEKNYRKRFMKIMEPLQHWVDKDSIILTDYTVDKGTLIKMGYQSVYQVLANESTPSNKNSNHAIMDYLRKIVPRMFQNTLSLLSRAIIQQFLDELVWRERWGQIPSKAFESIIEHIAEQTKLETGGNLINRLSKISSNPFKNWKYDRWAANCKAQVASSTARMEEDRSGEMAGCSSRPTIDNLPIAITQVEAGNGGRSTDTGLTRIEKQPPSLQAATIPLDPYYYGTLPGDPLLQLHNTPFHVECEICGEEFGNNVQLMDHLILHALNKSRSGDQKDICRLCCKVCPSQAALKTHHLQVHREGTTLTNSTSCKICAIKMRDRAGLIAHMTKTHFELEMPYVCEICNFRTSIWEAMVKHFYEVHNGAESGICPYCFRTVKFIQKGESIGKNQYFYIMHIQRHQLSSLVRKCTRCFQWFVNKALQERHEASAHRSSRHLRGVERHEGDVSVLMPAPLCDPSPPSFTNSGSKGGKSKYLQNTPNFKASNFRSIKISDYVKTQECAECEYFMEDEHYVGTLSCTRCRYNTCCTRAMAEHNSSSHMSWTPRFIFGRPPRSHAPLTCDNCSATYTDPILMARHLSRDCEGSFCLTAPTRGLVRKSSEDTNSPTFMDTTEDSLQEREEKSRMEVEEDEGESMSVDPSPSFESMVLD